MTGGVLHLHREFAAAPVEVERAGLEDRALAPVERLERHEVVQQHAQVALQPQQLLEVGQQPVVMLGGLVFGNECEQRVACREQGIDAFTRQARERVVRARGDPRVARREPLAQHLPLGFFERVAFAEQRHHRVARERGHGLGPGGIEARTAQRQCAMGRDRRQR
ncbi:hypothetical protein FQZ97_729460 [compost metagenome]